MKPNTNILYYFEESDREKRRMENIVAKLGLNYVPVKLKPKNVTESFVYLILEHCENGFDDIIKNTKKMNLDFDVEDLKTSELVKMISQEPQRWLKPSFFLGLSGGEGVVTSQGIEDLFTRYLKYEQREMAKIYG